jgi:DNA-directed RNA polymerase sigma subunit (sigma70/sigma32)
MVVAARFGLEGHPHGQSLAIIASQVGLCKERVRQILSQALLKLRSELTVEEQESIN